MAYTTLTHKGAKLFDKKFTFETMLNLCSIVLVVKLNRIMIKNTLLMALFLSVITVQSQEPSSTPLLSHAVQSGDYLMDFEGVLTGEEKSKLEESIKRFERTTQSRLLIISVGEMRDFSDFDQYALKLIDELAVNEKLGKNGLALIFSGNLRSIHLNTEMERRKIVEDSVYSEVMTEIIIPAFKNRNYFQGLEEAISEILHAYND